MKSQYSISNLFLLLFFSLTSSVCFAQVSTYSEKENIEFLSGEKIRTELHQFKEARTTLPRRVDHSQSKYMSSLVNQGSMGSCGSASRICYMFAYEINNYRNLSGKVEANMYPSHFTWLLTGQNSDKENMAIFNGIPTVPVYGGRQYNSVYGGNVSWPDKCKNYGWMTGFDKWRSAMDNRLEKTSNIKMNTDEALEYVKWWIYNHHDDESFNEGGVVGGGAATSGWKTVNIPSGKYEGGKLIVTEYGPGIDHGIVFSGYDDDIEYDLNGNGKIDDDERGALILLNSWGNWGNNGCVYVPYKIVKEYGGGLSAELYYIRKDYKPQDVFRIKMNYNQRANIKVSIGVSSDPNATEPDETIVAEHFNYAGFEPIPLLGEYSGVINNNPMEFGLDLTDLTSVGFDTRKNFRYFLVLELKSGSTGLGSVQELEVIRYGENKSEVVGKINTSVTISGAGKKIFIPVSVPANSNVRPTNLYVPQKRLKVKSYTSQETSGEGSSNGRAIHAIDGNEDTYWHSRWSSNKIAFPHKIVFEVDSAYMLNGFEYLPRQDSGNGRIGDYEFYVSDSATEQGVLVAGGTFENDGKVKRSFFEPIAGKYVTLINKRSSGGDDNTCIVEFNLFYSLDALPANTDVIPQNRLSVKSKTSEETVGEGDNNGKAIYAIDGNESSYWHSQWKSDAVALPHDIVFEIDSVYTINGFDYLPRQDGNANGRIGDYELYVSNSVSQQGTLVASGTFEDDESRKRVFFEPTKGKYVKFVNKKSANGALFTCVAEFNLYYTIAKDIADSFEPISEERNLIVVLTQDNSILEVSGVSGNVLFTICDIRGRVVLQEKLNTAAGESAKLNVSGLAKGTYILHAISPEQKNPVKFILY
ncbi:hypothetical protein D0T49_06490 [Paludibacter sp. 221]|uniref:discoidin domain-containing protein n=1 Tax=Paludibacter sp. 221 TaxID=2302939 RepID=UPI0013D28827|nr:discoidin domain-containing protein [Paludibacter sp. 221]NDV46692.1 hypothetical protein [Paludibacter sp. 221]